MYNFLGLVNTVNWALNETPLTDVNFSSATGYYLDAKRAVNASVRKINQIGVEWPFNHTTETLVLTPEQVRYPFPATAKKLMMNSFRLEGDTSQNVTTRWLAPLDYEAYLQAYSDMEYKSDVYKNIPTNVFRTPDLKFGIIPPPDKAYQIQYEFSSIPADLEEWDDVPTIPEIMKHVIHDGAMYYAYFFRGDTEKAVIQEQGFNTGINQMRDIYIHRSEYVRSTQLRK